MIDPHRPVVFLEGSGKVVGTVVFGDEIKVRDIGGIKGSPEGFHPGIAYGGGGESPQKIGVVRGRGPEVFPA